MDASGIHSTARRAAADLDEIRRQTVAIYARACSAVIAEHDRFVEQFPDGSPEREQVYDRIVDRLVRLRAAVLEIYQAASSLRTACGIIDVPSPQGDRETILQYSTIRMAHQEWLREQSGDPEFDFDEALERHYESLAEGCWPWMAERGGE